MTVHNFMSKVFSYQDLRRGNEGTMPPGAYSDKNTPGQKELMMAKQQVTVTLKL